MKKKPLKILAIIFLLSLIFNLYLSLSSPYLNNDKSYFNLRVIDQIKNTGLPIFYDELSYEGRYLIVQPFFHYLFMILSFVPFYFNIFPALLVSSLVLISYFIAREITNDENSSLITALLAGFVPIYSKTLINQFTIYTLVLPLIAFMILCFIKLEEKKYFVFFIIGGIILSLTHSSSFLLLFIFLFYILLVNVENIKLIKLKKETLLFMFFLIFMINILFFRKAFFQYGLDVVYGNNPLFNTINIFQSFYLLGVIPLFLGIIGLYQGFFGPKKEQITLIYSIILGILFLFLIRLIDIKIGLLFLSFGLVIASSLAIKNFFVYLDKTKFSNSRRLAILVFIIFFIGLSFLPTYFNYKEEFTDLNDFEWLKNNVDENSVILTPLEYGHLVPYFSDRINVIDSNFLLAPDPIQRYHDINLIYSGWSYNKAIELLKDYSVDYIYISKDVKNIYNIDDLPYLENEECIRRIKESIYQFVC